MPREYIGPEDRQYISERAGGRCEYCKSPAEFATQAFSIEYAKTEAADPVDGTMVSLYNPRTQVWLEHFRWHAGFTLVAGVTPPGRATVEALHLNRPGIVNMRRVLFMAGCHPPSG